MGRSILLATTLCLCLAGWSLPAAAQTLTGTVIAGANGEGFFFDLTDSGQARFNLTWEDSTDLLSLIVGCDDGEGGTLIFGTSISGQDRVATLDVGIVPGTLCVAVVDVFTGAFTDFAINLQVTDPDGLVLEDARLSPAGDPALLEGTERRLVEDVAARSAALRSALRTRIASPGEGRS